MKMKLLLPVLLLGSSTANAALQNLITVTTWADENGTGAACSLREAVQAVVSRAAYGGCAAGSRTANNVIQLDHGVYTLTEGPLVMSAAITLAGKDTNRPDDVNPYTNTKPVRLRPDDASNGTKIVGKNNNRLIYASSDLAVRDVVLQASGQVPAGDNGGHGGVIYAASSLTLDNVQVIGGNAAGDGGGVLLTGNGSALTLSNVQMTGNIASGKGGAIALQCNPGFVSYPKHVVSISSSYLGGNTSATGAGAVELCGDVTGTISVSTVAGNTSAAASGALAYQMASGAPMGVLGSITINSVTAIANNGYGLALNGISTATFSNTVIAFNSGGGSSTGGCLVGPDAVTYKSGTFNATNDAATTGCSAFYGTATSNLILTTTMADEFGATADYHGALTKNYLPGTAASTFIRDKGDVIANCAQADQRGIIRRSGSNCDIGAVERLVLTANDDTGTSGSNREAWVDILANDAYGETAAGPNHWDESASVVKILTMSLDGWCEWDNDKRQLHAYTINSSLLPSPPYPVGYAPPSTGKATAESAPITCTYQVQDVNAGSTSANAPSTTPATVEINILNAAPVLVNDVVVRPVGQSSVTFNPLDNDSDKVDGAGRPTVWASYPIYIASNPSLGTLDLSASASGHCPDWTATNQKICYRPPLKYVASNNLSPFTDSFAYVAYDSDGKPGAAASVTLKTDAPDPDKGETGGSFDLLGGLALLLLSLRRLRRL